MPMQEESLLVPKTKWVGRPEKAIRYTGTEIMPPPPAMASIKPARKTPPQIRRTTHRGKPSSVVSVKRVRTEADIYAPPGVNSTKSLSVYQLHRPLARAEAPQFC